MSQHPHAVEIGSAITTVRTIASYFIAVTGIIDLIFIKSETTPAGDVTFGVLKNGSTIFASPTDRPKIIGGTTSILQTGLSLSVTRGDKIEITVDAIAAFTSVGAKLHTQLNVEDGLPTAYGGTSTSSLAIGTGSKTFTTQAGLAYVVGSRIRLIDSADITKWMEGVVTAYTGTSMTFTSDVVNSSGTISTWNVSLAGSQGATGATGATGSAGSAGSAGVGVPVGGTTGQVLKKQSGTDYDTVWDDESGGGGGGSPTIAAKLTISTTEAMTNNSWTTLTWDVVLQDDGPFYNVGSASRLTALATGWHVITATVRFAANGSGQRFLRVIRNGSGSVHEVGAALNANSSFQTVVNGTTLVYATAGDYFQVEGYQNSGGSLNVEDSQSETNFGIAQLTAGSGGGGGATRTPLMSDTFPGSSLDGAKWISPSGTVTVASNKVQLVSNTGNDSITTVLAPMFEFKSFEAKMLPAVATAKQGIGISDTAHYAFMHTDGTKIKAFTSTVSTEDTDVAYNATDHAYFRVVGMSGRAIYQVSPDGVDWTTIWTQAVDLNLQGGYQGKLQIFPAGGVPIDCSWADVKFRDVSNV